MVEVSITLHGTEWIQIIQRTEDDDFYYMDYVAQDTIKKIKEALKEKGILV